MIRSHIMRLSMWSSEGGGRLTHLMNPAILISFDYQRGSVTEGQRGGRQSTDFLVQHWWHLGASHHGGLIFLLFLGRQDIDCSFFFRRTHDGPKQGSNTKNERHSNQDTPAPGTFFYWTRWWFHQEDLRFEVRMLWQIPPFPVPL